MKALKFFSYFRGGNQRRTHGHASLCFFIALLVASNLHERVFSQQLGNSFVGVQSCSTSTCHGNEYATDDAWRNSVIVYFTEDPHATAGLLLRDQDSQRIVRRLNPEAVESRVAYDNVLRSRCIACHVTSSPADGKPAGEIADETLARGVSCESCHGPASGWLDAHVRTSWRGTSSTSRNGFRDNASMTGRAETCLRCHVGSRTADGLIRDVNHDLIAAGHPPLRFDLWSYLENLPAHWDTTKPSEQVFSQSALRTRAVGRKLSLAAAADLFSQRATDHLERPTNVPWPELADYDCFSCHQSLSIRSYQLPADEVRLSDLQVSEGLPIWNAWHSLLQLNLRGHRTMRYDLSPQGSDPRKAAVTGARIAREYREAAATAAREKTEPGRVALTLQDQLEREAPHDWHEAAIQYLRIDALLHDLELQHNLGGSVEYSEAIRELEGLLRFSPSDTQSPPDKSGVRDAATSPVAFNAERFRRTALSLLEIDAIRLPDSQQDGQ